MEQKNIPVIVHTKRGKFLLQLKFPKLKVIDFPISFLNATLLENYKKNIERNIFLKKYGFPSNSIVLGIFGFISEYKGHEIAIKALSFLPSNYHLAFFGAQHPFSINSQDKIDSYINSLLNLIVQKKLTRRVHFLGALNDEEFIQALLCCNYNILPYYETNQSGSGVASLSLETGTKMITSQNYTFLELAKYAPDAFKIFSIGNYLELANCILNFQEPLPGQKEYFKTYNRDNMIKIYMKTFDSIA